MDKKQPTIRERRSPWAHEADRVIERLKKRKAVQWLLPKGGTRQNRHNFYVRLRQAGQDAGMEITASTLYDIKGKPCGYLIRRVV